MKIYKKHNISLIEVIISLFLTSIILTVLFTYFVQITKIETQLEIAKRDVFAKQHIQIRLSNILSQATTKKISDKKYFFSEKQDNDTEALYFTFDNGIDPDPKFSGYVVGKLYLDNEKNLALKIWATENDTIINDLSRKEILMRDIKDIKYQFLALKDPNSKNLKTQSITKDLEWISFWPQEKSYLPAIVIIKLSNELDFSFFLPSNMINITYQNKRAVL